MVTSLFFLSFFLSFFDITNTPQPASVALLFEELSESDRVSFCQDPRLPGQSFSKSRVKIILADSEMSHCLLAADAYLKLVKVRRRSGSHKDVLCRVFSIAGGFVCVLFF